MSRPDPVLPLPDPIGHYTLFRVADHDYVSIYVEGDDDVETWRPWLKWLPLSSGGKPRVLAHVSALLCAGIRACLGIVDADRDRLEGPSGALDHIATTAAHDMESDLVASPVLDRLFGAVPQDRLAVIAKDLPAFRNELLTRAVPYGLIRWIFHKRRFEYPDGRLSCFRFTDRDSWTVDHDRLHAEAATVLGESRSALEAEAAVLGSRISDPWQLCNGHDLVNLLAVALQGPLGCRTKFPSPEVMGTMLRMALGAEHLESLDIWRYLGEWERQNAPLVVRKPRGSP